MKLQNLNTLYHFHIIAKHRSLSTAAQELHLSAPAITHSLKGLEDSIQETLCIRTRSQFTLTAAGLDLFQSTQKIFAELESYEARQKEVHLISPILSIGTLDNFENPRLESAIKKICKQIPQVKLNLQSYDSETINRLLLQGELDFGFGIFSSPSARLKYQKIGEEKLSYYISKNHPLWSKKRLTKEDLANQKVTWLDNRNRKKSDLELNIFVENLKYKMQFYGFTNNLTGALQILLSGHTVVPLPESFGKSLEKNYPVRSLKIESKAKVLDQLVAFNPSAANSPVLQIFISYFQD